MSDPASPAAKRSPLLIIFFTVFLDLLGFGIIIPVLPFYAEQYGASPFMVSLLNTSYSLMQFVFAPMWGRLSDRIGRRPILLLGVAMSVVGYSVFGLAHALEILFVSRILAGIGNANISTAQAYIADVTTPENRAKGMGILGMSFGLGFILGPALGGAAASLGRWMSDGNTAALFNQVSVPAFLAAGLAALDLVLAFFFLPESVTPEMRAQPSKRAAFLSPAVLFKSLSAPVIGILLVVNFLFIFGWANVEGTFGLLLERMYIPNPGTRESSQAAIVMTSTALTVIGVVGAIVQGGLIGKFTKRFGERVVLVAGLLITSVTVLALSYAQPYAMLFPVLVVMAFGNGLVNPSISSLISRSAPASEQGLTLGLSQSLSALARATGPAWGGFLFEPNYHVPYISSAVLVFISAALALSIRKKEV